MIVPLYIGTASHKEVFRSAEVVKVYDKGHLGKMYLCKTIPHGVRTCVVIPPPVPPHLAKGAATLTPIKPTTKTILSTKDTTKNTDAELVKKYEPMLLELGLDTHKKRSLKQLRSIAYYRGYDIGAIEN